jgi:hypothetical protein
MYGCDQVYIFGLTIGRTAMPDLREAINSAIIEMMRREHRSDGFMTKEEWIKLILQLCPGPAEAAEGLYRQMILDGFLAHVESADAQLKVYNPSGKLLSSKREITPELVGPGPNNPFHEKWKQHLRRLQGEG